MAEKPMKTITGLEMRKHIKFELEFCEKIEYQCVDHFNTWVLRIYEPNSAAPPLQLLCETFGEALNRIQESAIRAYFKVGHHAMKKIEWLKDQLSKLEDGNDH